MYCDLECCSDNLCYECFFARSKWLLYIECVFVLQAKFLAVLIVIPWALDFLVHDYVLMPFLDR